VKLEAAFAPVIMGPLAIHPRQGSKHHVEQPGVFDPSVHEVFEVQHRAQIMAKKLRVGTLDWRPLRLIYLWPDRPIV